MEQPISPKTVTLVGHCGPDSSFLRMAISQAAPGTIVAMADSDKELEQAAERSDLLLFNRVLEVGFDDSDGIALLRRTKELHPGRKMMMVSNFPEAQQAAEAAGALPGFGKRELGSEKVKRLIADALAG